jgi:hypothetical protein
MIFNKENLIKILKLNFGYKIIDDDIFGEVIELDARIAYRFCLTTNTYYLVDKYGLRLFGRFRTFNHRNFSLNPGLFLMDPETEELSDENLPRQIFDKFPFVYEGKKKLIFIESHNTPKVIEETYKDIILSGKNPDDYILNLVHKDGSQWEHYFEFMASELFIKKGYLTDIQLPWSYHGTPDFGIFKHSITEKLKSVNLIENGALILELSSLRIFNKKTKSTSNLSNNEENYKFIVGEVKTKQTKSQILEYLKTGLCFKGYEFIPNKKKKEQFCGLIKIQDNKIIIEESPESEFLDSEKVKVDFIWFNQYIKIHLLGNLELSEIKKLLSKYIESDKMSFSNLIKLLDVIKINDLIEVINNGI